VRYNARRTTIETVLVENTEHLVVVSILERISIPINAEGLANATVTWTYYVGIPDMWI